MVSLWPKHSKKKWYQNFCECKALQNIIGWYQNGCTCHQVKMQAEKRFSFTPWDSETKQVPYYKSIIMQFQNLIHSTVLTFWFNIHAFLVSHHVFRTPKMFLLTRRLRLVFQACQIPMFLNLLNSQKSRICSCLSYHPISLFKSSLIAEDYLFHSSTLSEMALYTHSWIHTHTVAAILDFSLF